MRFFTGNSILSLHYYVLYVRIKWDSLQLVFNLPVRIIDSSIYVIELKGQIFFASLSDI